MTKEEKELSIRALCARLPYKVMVQVTGDWFFYDELPPYNNILTISKLKEYKEGKFILKPYLRPMSSMTKEERKELLKFGGLHISESEEVIDVACIGFKQHSNVQDWLNKHHFDYRGLIEKGLALPALEGMYG